MLSARPPTLVPLTMLFYALAGSCFYSLARAKLMQPAAARSVTNYH
jgi:hypothetical protein